MSVGGPLSTINSFGSPLAGVKRPSLGPTSVPRNLPSKRGREVEFAGPVSFRHITFVHPVGFQRAVFHRTATFADSRFKKAVDFTGARFHADLDH